MNTTELSGSTWGLPETEDIPTDGGSNNNAQQWTNLCQDLMDTQGLGAFAANFEGSMISPDWPNGYVENQGGECYNISNDGEIDTNGSLSSTSSFPSVDESGLSPLSKSTKPSFTSEEISASKTGTTQPVACKRRRRPAKRPADLEETETSVRVKRQRRTMAAGDGDNRRRESENAHADDEKECDKYLQQKAQQDSRRSRLREKNRIAAGRCRSKKRKAVSQLASKHEKLEGMNRQLCGTLNDLEAEAYVLKNMLMAHGNSGCELIQQYFRDLAANLILRMNSSTMEQGQEGEGKNERED